MEVSVRELKNHLSEYLRRAQAGEEVTVTSRGKVIARLSGAREQKSEADAIRHLQAQPWATPPRKPGRIKGSDRPTHVAPGTTDEIMRRVRGE